jgi:hypothetical protein
VVRGVVLPTVEWRLFETSVSWRMAKARSVYLPLTVYSFY